MNVSSLQFFDLSFGNWHCRWLVAAIGLWSCVTLLPAEESRNDSLDIPPLLAVTDHSPSPIKIRLGQALFFDKRLSGDGTISCASCHQPERAFTDGRALAQGINGRIGARNTPTLLNAAFNTSQFWDGRRASLADQAPDPFDNAQEHGLKDHNVLLELLRNDADYTKAFRAAFQVGADQIGVTHVSQAIASFEQTLVAGGSAFDRFYFRQKQSALSPSVARGLALFKGSAQCANCHTIGKTEALLTDNQFHSLNVGLSRIAQRLPELTSRLVQSRARGANLDHAVLSDGDIAELG